MALAMHGIRNRPTTLNKKTQPLMPRITSVAILVAGIILLVYGFNASDSVSSSVSRAVTGSPTDKTVWLIALGVIGVITGGFGLVFRKAP
jgi:hypothetical protein